jgi:hypothetical protein
MAAIGRIYPRIYRRIQPYSGIMSNGAETECLTRFSKDCIGKCKNTPKKTALDAVAGKTLAQRASIKTKSSCHLHLHQRYQASSRVFVRLGLPFFTHCTKANVSDDQGLIDRLGYFRAKPVNISKITILHRRWLPSQHHWRYVAIVLSANHDQDSRLNWLPNLRVSRESRTRSIWICPGGNPMGH